MFTLGAHVSALPSSPPHAPLLYSRRLSPSPTAPAAAAASTPRSLCFPRRDRSRFAAERTGRPTMAAAIPLEAAGGLAHDLGSAAVTAGVALALLKFFEELAKRGVFDQKLSRKLVHISVGLVFLLFWPLFSSGTYAPFLAALAPGVNIIRMLLLGLGLVKNEAMVKSISRSGDHRELLKGPLYYATTITFATSVLWRSSPIAIALICNLCAGDVYLTKEARILLPQVARLFLPQEINGCNQFLCSGNSEVNPLAGMLIRECRTRGRHASQHFSNLASTERA
ncbi:hypothetical protein C2845_PM07G27480 [Panicum miliaceum]|uniref:Uncharacterized protein n=1 Tax=Panicum miliaceum TaxID=4540 RepID=A0A3L6SQH4_PANMI|nr:hypothetical protein C2845_PM07G27480 [Panicum miliaceum]